MKRLLMVLAPIAAPRRRILRSKDVVDRLQGLGMSPASSSPDELAAHVDREIARWGKVVREAGIKVE